MHFKGEIKKTFELSQKLEFAILFLKRNDYGTLVLEMFWGAWLFPFGCWFINRDLSNVFFGILLIIAGVSYVVDSSLFILFPNYHAFVKQAVLLLFAIGEISITLWLLIKGIENNVQQSKSTNNNMSFILGQQTTKNEEI